jgi:FAD binding domain
VRPTTTGGVAAVQPGLTLGELVAAIEPRDLVTTTGIVSTTGLAGLALGRGIGWLSGCYGLTCDNLVAAEVVTADGRVLRASTEENPDLVAKVCSACSRPAWPAALAAELEIALHLGGSGAPIALPSADLPAIVYRAGDHALTFWWYEHQDPRAALDGRAAARALRECQRGLDASRGHRPSFLDRRVARAGRLLAKGRVLTELLEPDRAFLSDQFRRLTEDLSGCFGGGPPNPPPRASRS